MLHFYARKYRRCSVSYQAR